MRYLFYILILVSSYKALSHPVSFKDATSIMSFNDGEMNEILLTYSLSHKLALGHTYIKEDNSELYVPRVNWLAHRWNNENSQGNLYLSAGAGIERYNNENANVRLAEFVADWESRKYYTYYEHLHLLRENKNNPIWPQRDDNHSKLRLGFAPFLADYSDLNIWFITQFSKHNEENTKTTQFMRFYIKNVLWEIGADLNGGFAFNFMIHL